jgi:hypothetical protein
MLPKTTIVRKMLALIEAGKMKEAAVGLSDDFMFSGLLDEPMNKKQFLGFMRELLAAFPLWSFGAGRFSEEGDTVKMKMYMMGTNNGPLTIPSFGLNVAPATGKHIVLPAESAEATVKDEQLTELKVAVAPGGDIGGILRQLGIEKNAAKA